MEIFEVDRVKCYITSKYEYVNVKDYQPLPKISEPFSRAYELLKRKKNKIKKQRNRIPLQPLKVYKE